MAGIFNPNKNYALGDPALDLIGTREKLAQWRHRSYGPSYFKLGKKVIYSGADLNDWTEAHRVTPDTA